MHAIPHPQGVALHAWFSEEAKAPHVVYLGLPL